MRKMKDSGIEWIGEIPESWDVSKSKYFYTCLDGRRVPLDASQRNPGQYPYWGAGSIMDYIDDFIFDEEIVLLGEDGAPFFDKNRPVSFVVNEKVWVNNHIHVIKPNSDVNAKFMMYWFNTVDYGTYINGSILNKLTQSNMDNIAFVKVPYDEQVQIVNHLDKKCAEIDAIIAAKEKTNELLKERRQSIIYEAVTKGLDPTVPMKDSGIEWIGDIPESWSFSKLKYDAYMKGRIGWQGLKADEFIEEGPYLVTGTDFEDGRVCWERSYHISDERFNEAPEIQLKEADLLITKDGTIGKLAYIDFLPGPASLNSHLLVIRPKKERFLNKYLYWVLSSDVFFQYTEYAQDGTIMASLSQEKISQFVFGLPPIDEQDQIARFLDEKCAELDALICSNESTIEKLKEYRQSVIYEAVTGKIEI